MVNRSADLFAHRGARTGITRCAALVMIATLVGCSGEASTGAGPTSPPASSVVAPDVTPPPTPAQTAATAPAPTTPPVASTATPASDAPPSTERPALSEDEAKQDVIEAAIASWTAFNNVLLDPGNDELLRALALTRTGEALDRAIEIVILLRGEGRKSITNSELPALVTIFPESVSVDLEAGTARVEYCRLGSNVAVEVGANTDGSDRVVDDSVNSYHERDDFVLTDGDWRKSSGQTVQVFQGAARCLDE